MTFRRVLFIGCAAAVLGLGWQHRETALKMIANHVEPPKPAIQFDNGTVREPRPSARTDAISIAPGAPRKCISTANSVTYTDKPCAAGSKERPVAGTPVTVLPSAATAAAAKPNGQEAPKGAHRVLVDAGRNDRLREKMIERAVEGL